MYVFSHDAVRKLQRDHERLAYAPLSPVPSSATKALRPAGPGLGFFAAKTTTEITAMAGDVPGTGSVKLYKVKSNGEMEVVSDGTVTVNNLGGAIAQDTYCLMSQDSYGSWWLVVVPCE